MYATELGQSNFYHVFGIDLHDYMKAITRPNQYWWVEGIRGKGVRYYAPPPVQEANKGPARLLAKSLLASW